MDVSPIIRFSIRYLPSIIFALIILAGILKGFIRGLRKTSIYLLHSIICATICLILFFTLVNIEAVDEFLLNTTNSFLGSSSIQSLLKVSEGCKTFREVFIEFIPKQLYGNDFMTALALMISDDGAQLSALIDIAYRLVFGFALYLLYLLLRLFLYIGYNAFKCGKRYDRKRDNLYQVGKVDTPARRNRILGASLGGGIGLFKGILGLSFIGTFLFVFAGGIGNKASEDIEFTDKNFNIVSDAYDEIGSYGSYGIYKILNLIRDEKDVPYYLLATNLLFKGNLNDKVRGVNKNIYLTDELASYVSFSRDTVSLFVKYDDDRVIDKINNGGTINVMDEIITVFKNQEFQEEFKVLIENFDSKTYFINLTLSLVDTITSNLDKLEFSKDLADKELAPVRIMFEKGYLCPSIPSEKELIGTGTVLPYIRASQLLKRSDITVLYDIFMNLIDNYYKTEDGDFSLTSLTDVIRNTVSNITELSILSTSRANEIDPILKRLFEYFEYEYMGGISEKVIKTIDEEKMNVSWIEEIRSITDYITCGLDIYDSALNKAKENDPDASVDGIMIFNELYEPEHIDMLKHLILSLSSSKLLGNLLSANSIIDGMTIGIHSMSAGSAFPSGISIGDKYDENGIFVGYGELHYLLKSVLLLADNEEARNAFSSILFNNDTEISGKDTIVVLMDAFIGDEDGDTSVIDTLINSRIVSSIISNYLINFSDSFGEFRLFIDESIKEVDNEGNTLRIINDEEIHKLFNNSKFISYMVKETMKEDFDANKVINDVLFGDEYDINELLDSKIIEGSLSDFLFNHYSSGDGGIIIPNYLKNNDDVLISKNGKSSEIVKLQRALNIDEINTLFDDEATDEERTNFVIGLNKSECDIIFASDILYYSLSNHFSKISDFNGIEIIIPDSVKEPNDNDIVLINKNEIKTLVINIAKLAPTKNEQGEYSTNDTLTNILDNPDTLDNLITNASVANYIIDHFGKNSNDNFKLEMNGKYETLVPDGEPKSSYSRKSPWYSEVKVLVNGLNEILEGAEGDLVDEDVENRIISDIKFYNLKKDGNVLSKLDIVYASNILADTLSNVLDKKLTNPDNVEYALLKDEEVKEQMMVNSVRYKKTEIAGLINVIILYDIDPNNMSDDDIKEISDDIKKDFPSLLSEDIFVTMIVDDEEITVTEDYYYFESKDSKKRRLDVVYISTIMKDQITKEFIGSNVFSFTTDEDKQLITDDNGYILKIETEVAINLLQAYDIHSLIDDEGRTIQPKESINSMEPIRKNKEYFMSTHLLSLIMFDIVKDAVGEYKPFSGIPSGAKLYYRGHVYNALTDEEIEAILLIVDDDNDEQNDSKFGVVVENGTIRQLDNFETDYTKLTNEDIAILTKSYLASNYEYNRINLGNKEEFGKLERNSDNNEFRYFELHELLGLYNFLMKYGNIDALVNADSLYIVIDASVIDKQSVSPDIVIIEIRDCTESEILSSILFEKITNLMYEDFRNDAPSGFKNLNPAKKKNEVIAITNVMEAFEINSISGIRDGLATKFISGGQINKQFILDNLDIIYQSYIVSNNLSESLLYYYRNSINPSDSQLYSLCTHNAAYDNDYGRIRKHEMEVLVNTEYDDVTINSADSKKYDSVIYRYRITINSNLSTYGEGCFAYYNGVKVITTATLNKSN